MSKTTLSRSVFELLIKHLVDMEDEKERIIEEYYPSYTKERDSFEHLMNQYIAGVEKIITAVKPDESIDSGCPFAIIGSVVEVEDLTYNEVEKFQIISPFNNNVSISWDCASYLSPLGKGLLLKGIGDKVEVDTPGGGAVYQIKSIELP